MIEKSAHISGVTSRTAVTCCERYRAVRERNRACALTTAFSTSSDDPGRDDYRHADLLTASSPDDP